jgi:hypothetical protein
MAALELTISTSVSVDLAQSALTTGLGFEDAERLLSRLTTGGATDDERAQARLWLYQLASARGRPAFAARLFDGMSPLPSWPMFARMFEGGDSAIAVRARRDARSVLSQDRILSSCTDAELAAAYDLLVRGDPSTAMSTARTIDESLASLHDVRHDECALAAMSLRVLLAARANDGDLSARTVQLDSALRTAPESPLLTLMTGNIIAVRAFEQLGDVPRALNAARRRPIPLRPSPRLGDDAA